MAWGHLNEDRITIERPVARDPRDRKRMAIVATGREARTDLVRLARFHPGDFLRAHLHSGRTHQIRVHLASAGHPVMGDDTYGGGGGRRLVGLPPKRHFLHAAWLRFAHPISGEAMDLRTPLPRDLRTSHEAINDNAMELGENPLETLGFYNE
jgi:23S rRNA pseudouridine1911/1915/1917 synthase